MKVFGLPVYLHRGLLLLAGYMSSNVARMFSISAHMDYDCLDVLAGERVAGRPVTR